MKKLKNVLSFVLVLTILVTTMGPFGNIAKAESEKEAVLLEISDLKVDIKNAVQSVQDIEPKNDDEKELLDKYHEAAKDINRELEISEEKVAGAVGIGEGSVYDLTTIPVRIQLLIRLGRAIRFATTELSNKVVAAHTKIAEYILTGILYVVNPFASEGQIIEYMEKFEALQEELLQYPDLRPEDIATIYKKAAFSRELSEARRVYNSQNRVTKQFRAKPLKEAIDEGSRMWWRLDVTCGELDAQVEKVHAEMEKITGPKIRVERIEFMEGEAGYITIDKKTRIRPVIFPNEVKNKDVIIYSANPYIARVSAGEIIPQRTGSTEIIVTAKDNNVQGKFTLYVVEQGGYMDQIPPLQATGQNYGFELDPAPGHDDEPPIQHDKTEVKSVDFATDKITMTVGETYDLSAQALVYPVEAVNKSLSYTSENDTIADVDKTTGVVRALRPGLIKIFASSENGVMGSVYVQVKEKAKEADIEIVSVENTRRKAGIFSIEVEALNNGRAYNGYMTVEVTSGDKTLTKKVYMKQGKGSVKFNGFEFYVWLKDFHAKVTIKDQVKELDFSYR
ncbi:CAMP factor family pore-forming toxin [uncultured Fenollaria sp.]|uniref:CAMP factor family pore-forming toxin n=1 Tax=uncultured Fenollaria sp. TaxID=1686315 RepID=UPI0025FD775E|nr:CAMP factor family pore-forming toxin [uncultured Fenollaria sp.]